MIEYIVITGVPDMDDPRACTGNLALAFDVYAPIEGQTNPTEYQLVIGAFGLDVALKLRKPVFEVGEVLICREGREIPYPGRKPSKWGVQYETFDGVEDALTRARQAMGYEEEVA